MDEPKPLGWAIDHPDLLIGALEAAWVSVGPAAAGLAAVIDASVADAVLASAGPGDREARRASIRDLLRRGGYKPTGRGKPSSEYIANAAARGEFPRVNNVVDIANLVSLESGLPISLLDLDRALGDAPGLEVRFGRPGESYVFNASGQVIDVCGLICVARVGGEAVGNPVKDSMASKTDASTRRVLGVVYRPRSMAGREQMTAALGRFAALLADHAGAGRTRTCILPPE